MCFTLSICFSLQSNPASTSWTSKSRSRSLLQRWVTSYRKKNMAGVWKMECRARDQAVV
jgi:hypothetical protein